MKVQFRKLVFAVLALPVSLWVFAATVRSQSSDQNLPTPALANEINGRIPALDLGDARLTRHFYAFEGNPGDLLVTIDSKNLNGDVDVFTAVTYRPLIKTTVYAGSQSGEVTKGFYLRAHQILILRVEARTPNDEAGTYHIRFGGSFVPFSGGIPVAENTGPQDDSSRPDRSGKRLSSVGATIPEPVIATPPPTVEPKPVAETTKPAEDTAAAKETPESKATKAKPVRPTSTARNTRGRGRPARPKPTPAETKAAKTTEAKTEEAKTEQPKTEESRTTEAAKVEESKKATMEEKPAAATSEKPEAAKASTQELPLPGAHLIIELKDGTKIDRPMSTVRRVVVEGGTIVVLLKTGKIERIGMSTVARMAIEP
jgi:hypothetical protein